MLLNSKLLKSYLVLMAASSFLMACNKNQSFGGLPEFSVPLGSAPAPKPQGEEAVKEEVKEAVTSDPPDPVAMRMKEQWQLSLRFERGEVSVVQVEQKLYSQAQLTSRRLGRFAVEFWIGQELLERVRFNFPLLGESNDDSAIEAGLTTTASVEVPLVSRATFARILDRKTRREWLVKLPLSSKKAP